MATRYYDEPLQAHFYGPSGLMLTAAAVGSGCAFGTGFSLCAPCKIYGVRMFNVIPGNPTLRVGLFRDGVEQIAQTVDRPNCAVNTEIDLEFATPYVADWADLRFQRRNVHYYTVAVFDTRGGAGYRQYYSGGAHFITDHYGQLGVSYYPLPTNAGAALSYHSNGAGWVCPVASLQGSPAIAPLILPDEYTYEPTIWPHLYGEGHPGISVQVGGARRTCGCAFYIHQENAELCGVRFYTHDPLPWDAKCCIYQLGSITSSPLATGTVKCNGAGVYDCTFPAPITLPAENFRKQLGVSHHALLATVYNQTNANYTVSTWTGEQLFYTGYGKQPRWRALTSCLALDATGYPRHFIEADARPTSTDTVVYPISPLVRAAA